MGSVPLFSQLFHFYDNHPVRSDMKVITQDWLLDDSYIPQGS